MKKPQQHETIGVAVDNVQQPPLMMIIYLCDSEMFTDEVMLLMFHSRYIQSCLLTSFLTLWQVI